MSDTTSSKTTSPNITVKIGVLGWLLLIMFVLKLNPGGHLDSEVMNWSWWVVFAPILVPVAIVLGGLAILGVGALGLMGWDKVRFYRARNKRKKARENRKNTNTPPQRFR